MSIGADEWLDGTTVDPAIFGRWPGYRVVLVACDAVDVRALTGVADQLVGRANASARALGDEVVDPHVALWRQAYLDVGVKPRVARPSSDALIRRAASEAGLPRIGTLVDLYNAISVIERVPIGGEDLDRYDGPAALVLASGDEAFHTNANGEPVVDHPEPGEPVWIDRGGVTCRRWNWRQTTRTAIHGGTVRVGFIVDSLDAPGHAGAARVAAQLAGMVGGRCRTVDAFS